MPDGRGGLSEEAKVEVRKLVEGGVPRERLAHEFSVIKSSIQRALAATC